MDIEHWTIDSDGNGNFIIYPTALLGGGVLIMFILGIIRAGMHGSTQALKTFANQHSWLVVLILAIVGLVIALIVGFGMKKKCLFQSILFGISLPLSLSLVYGIIMDALINIAAAFEEMFLLTLIWTAPVALIIYGILALLALALGLCPYLIIMICSLERNRTTSILKTIFTVLEIVSIPLLFYFLYAQTSLPLYLMGCA